MTEYLTYRDSRKDVGLPLTPDDLRMIADYLDKLYEELPGLSDLEDGDWKWRLQVNALDDGGYLVGQFRAHHDGWFGFYPEGWQ